MSWILALVGGFIGASLAGAWSGFFGFVGGAVVGVLFASISTLRDRVAALEAELVHPRKIASAEAASAVITPAVQARASEIASDPGVSRSGPMSDRAVASTREDAGDKPARLDPGHDADSSGAPMGEIPPPMPPPADDSVRILHSREANAFERAVDALKEWFSEGNLPVKVGMLVLFVGVAALLKYAVDQRLLVVPIEMRLALVAVAALAALIFGWMQRTQRRVFALSLQGGALGVLMLTVFAAFRLYALLPATAAFVLIVVLVASGALLAVLQEALALAVLAFTAGFVAPILISTGSGNHVALFGWYAVLNAAVFAVAWARPWRVLNLLGFVFTFGIGTLWGYRYYTPANFATVEPFLVLFFLFYVGIGVLYQVRQPQARRPFVDGTLTFGTPLVAFPLQAALLEGNDLALAYSALLVGVLYAGLFGWLRRRESFRVQGEAFAGLAIVFATLAVPLALSAQWTAGTWALEGAALVWLGLREGRRLPRIGGIALQVLAAFALLWDIADRGYFARAGEWPILNGIGLGALMLALAGGFIAWQYERRERAARGLVWLAFLWACGWWALMGLREIDVHVIDAQRINALVGFAALSLLLATLLRAAIPWLRLGWIAVAVCALSLPLALGSDEANGSPLANDGWIAWMPFLLVALFALTRLRDPLQRGLSLAHVSVLFLLAVIAGLEMHAFAGRAELGRGWRATMPVLPLLALMLATWRAPALATWPLRAEFAHYRQRWFLPAMALLGVWWLATLGLAGEAAPLPFVPLLNPLELTQVAVLTLLFALARPNAPTGLRGNDTVLRNALLLASFVTLTVVTLRAVHHATGGVWNIDVLDSMVAQTSLTVVWSIVGVAAWIAGSRRGARPLWLAGAVLMGIVLAKLVLVDRQHVGNIPGIVSFIAVGLLLTVVGYFAPSPPRAVAREDTA